MNSEKFTNTSITIKGLLNVISQHNFTQFMLDIKSVNEGIGKKSPKECFNIALKQCETKVCECGSIIDKEQLIKNLECNCIPADVFTMGHEEYSQFLEDRRVLMANKIRMYYENL